MVLHIQHLNIWTINQKHLPWNSIYAKEIWGTKVICLKIPDQIVFWYFPLNPRPPTLMEGDKRWSIDSEHTRLISAGLFCSKCFKDVLNWIYGARMYGIARFWNHQNFLQRIILCQMQFRLENVEQKQFLALRENIAHFVLLMFASLKKSV